MMKFNKIHIRAILMMVIMTLLTFSCSDDDDKNFGSVSSGDLDALIVEAQTIMDNNPTSINPGDYQPGALEMISKALDKAIEIQTYAYADDQLAYGYNNLKNAMDKAKTMLVSMAIPWIKQSNDTYIQISDNIKEVLDGAWTIEIECYIVGLGTKGYSNNLFSCEQSGPDSGFGVRYFSDGKIQAVTGNNNWVDTGDQAGAGTMKAGQWMHVAMTNTGESQILYIDGLQVATNENAHLLAVDKPFVIGNSPMWTDRVCNTMVRNLRIWNDVRSAQQIADNKNAVIKGDESGLEMFFSFEAFLGNKFNDLTDQYTAELVGDVVWQEDGIPPVIELEYTSLTDAIAAVEAFKGEVTEGPADGDYPVGTLAYLDQLIAEGQAVVADAYRQDQIDDKAAAMLASMEGIKKMLVADSDGIFIDRNNADAVGLRITPNYTPQGDYTVEFNVKVKSLFGYGKGDLFNNGEYGLRVYGYEELTEENVLGSGYLWNYTNAGNGWEGPQTDPLVLKTGEWQHVAVVHDNTARTTKIFVDGVEKAVFEDIGAPKESGWGETWLGNGWDKLDGYIKDFRIWDVARDAADLDADIVGDEAGLNAYFPLDRVAGLKFNDVTGNYQGEMRGISWNK